MDTSPQHVIDFEAARKARDAGIDRAVAHAEAALRNWAETAYNFLVEFARQNPSFTTEDVRQEAGAAVPTPPDKRAWGGVMQRAARAGIVVAAGFVTAKSPKVHCQNIRLWRSTLCT